MGGIFGQTDPDAKKRFLAQFEHLLKEFEGKFGSVNCRDLKPAALSYGHCPCASKEEFEAKPCLIYVLECVEMIERQLTAEV